MKRSDEDATHIRMSCRALQCPTTQRVEAFLSRVFQRMKSDCSTKMVASG